MMKKIAVLLLGVCAVAMSAAQSYPETGFQIGMWFDYPAETMASHVRGVKFGLPVSAGSGVVTGWEVALFSASTREVVGLQCAVGATAGREVTGMQLAVVNVCTRFYGFQWGGVNTNIQFTQGLQLGAFNYSKADGFQVGGINFCADNAKFQLGVVNINVNGLLPVMILFNIGKF